MWRSGFITHLREALKAKVLRSDLGAEELKGILTVQYERWWNIKLTGLITGSAHPRRDRV